MINPEILRPLELLGPVALVFNSAKEAMYSYRDAVSSGKKERKKRYRGSVTV